MAHSKVIIIDYGSQVTQLIARRVREAGVYSEIRSCDAAASEIAALCPDALILSGGPASVGAEDSPALDPGLLMLGVPVLGICYGMQLLAHSLGGKLAYSRTREYGPAALEMCAPCAIWDDLDRSAAARVWMSHGDKVESVPPGFRAVGRTGSLPVAAMADDARKIYGLQFHPEVHHSQDGAQMLRNFLFRVAGLAPDWTMSAFIGRALGEIRRKAPDGEIICALSGGVDSSVVAALLHRAVGERLHCIFVDNGLLRLNEGAQVTDMLRAHFGLDIKYVHAGDLFLERLAGVEDPERKRHIIGHTFIDVFEREAELISGARYLAQGTLYPDVIESVSHKGPSAVIKSHHNVGGLPEQMRLELIEPLRELFKDEVRQLALELGMPEQMVWRHPFPGPGLAIRVLGPVSRERLEVLRKADRIVQEELHESGWYRKVWQGFAVLLPLRTVGVMGDGRTYENVVALRVVDSVDAMTADWSRLPPELLERISGRVIAEVAGVNRVVYDISSKPPSTIEWE